MPWQGEIAQTLMLGEKTDTKQPKLYDSIYVNFNKWEKLNDDDRKQERLQQGLRDEWCLLERGLQESWDDEYNLWLNLGCSHIGLQTCKNSSCWTANICTVDVP